MDLLDYKLSSGRKLNVAFNKEVPLLGESDRKILKTTAAGQQLIDTLSENGSITNALSVSLTEKDGNKTVAGLAAGGTLYNPGTDGSLFVTTTRKLSSNRTVAWAGHFTNEDQSAVVTLKLDKEGVDDERILSAGVNNEKLGAVAGLKHEESDRTLNAGVGIYENQFGLKTQYETKIDPYTKVSVSSAAERTTSLEAKLIRETGNSTVKLSCLLNNRQAELNAPYKHGAIDASVGTTFEKDKTPALVAALQYRRTF